MSVPSGVLSSGMSRQTPAMAAATADARGTPANHGLVAIRPLNTAGASWHRAAGHADVGAVT